MPYFESRSSPKQARSAELRPKLSSNVGVKVTAVHILFVDGLGGAKVWRRSLLARLREGGHETAYFSYYSPLHDFASIRARLVGRIGLLASGGDYALVGYSFGGVLIRSALQSLEAGTSAPKHLFLLGSPVRSLKLSKFFGGCVAYQLLTGDCGHLVASPRRMQEIGIPALPTTCIVGTKGIRGLSNLLSSRVMSDGMVSESESCPHRFTDVVRLPVSHPFLPESKDVSTVIINRLATLGCARVDA